MSDHVYNVVYLEDKLDTARERIAELEEAIQQILALASGKATLAEHNIVQICKGVKDGIK